MVLEYNVDKFDTINEISNRFGVSVQEIKKINNITDVLPNKILIPNKENSVKVIANFKREFLYFGDGNKVKGELGKQGLYCNNLTTNINLFKPKSKDYYVVCVGDTINSICLKFNLNKEEIIKLNNLTTTKLFVGQIIKLK